MSVQINAKMQTGAKSSKKQTARKTVISSIPTRNTLKKFAPLSIKLRSSSKQKWKRTTLDGKFKVKRTFQERPDDTYDLYYRYSPDRHHIWTNDLVINSDTKIDYLLIDKKYLSLEDLEKCNQECLDDPESHFYLIGLCDEIGHGLFARHAIAAS